MLAFCCDCVTVHKIFGTISHLIIDEDVHIFVNWLLAKTPNRYTFEKWFSVIDPNSLLAQ
jgi:hypothetical protein